MKLLYIDKDLLEQIIDSVKKISINLEIIHKRQFSGKLNGWLDNQDVCLLLCISLRTLQSLRTKGALSYTQINHKMYYKASDIQKYIDSHKRFK